MPIGFWTWHGGCLGGIDYEVRVVPVGCWMWHGACGLLGCGVRVPAVGCCCGVVAVSCWAMGSG